MITPQALITWSPYGKKGHEATAKHNGLMADVVAEDRHAADGSIAKMFLWEVIRTDVRGETEPFVGRGEAPTFEGAKRLAGCLLVGIDEGVFAVRVVKPGHPDVTIGPIFYQYEADSACAAFTGMRGGTAMPEGTTWKVVAYDPAVPTIPVPDTDTHKLAAAVAEENRQKGSLDYGARFPDLWFRLHAFHGYEQASAAYHAASVEVDHDAEVDQLNGEVGDQVRVAMNAIATVRHTISELCSNRLYDIEWAEGGGSDALAELDEVERKLRHVRRIAEGVTR